MLHSILLLTAILAAMGAPASPAVKRYIDVQFVTTLLLAITVHTIGWQNSFYRFQYSVCGLLILWMCWKVVEESGTGRFVLFMASLNAIALALAVYFSVPKPLTVDGWILLSEGFLLTFVGTALGFRAPFGQSRMILCTLTVLWLANALFDFGYLLGKPQEWSGLADWLTYILGIGAYGWIAVWPRISSHPSPPLARHHG